MTYFGDKGQGVVEKMHCSAPGPQRNRCLRGREDGGSWDVLGWLKPENQSVLEKGVVGLAGWRLRLVPDCGSEWNLSFWEVRG